MAVRGWNTLKALISVICVAHRTLPFLSRFHRCVSHPLPHLLFKAGSKASVYYEEPRALCRVVLSNNSQWRQRLSVWAGEREGEGRKKERDEMRRRRGGERRTWKRKCVKNLLCLCVCCSFSLFMCHINTVRPVIPSSGALKHRSVLFICWWILFQLFFLSPGNLLLFFSPTASEQSRSGLLCSVTHYIPLYGPITGAPVFMSYRAAVKEDSLCSRAVVRERSSLLCHLSNPLTNVAYAICFWRWPSVYWDDNVNRNPRQILYEGFCIPSV